MYYEAGVHRTQGHTLKATLMASDKRKQSLYFPAAMLEEIEREALRLDRTRSWIVQRCVRIALSELTKLPSINDPDEQPTDD